MPKIPAIEVLFSKYAYGTPAEVAAIVGGQVRANLLNPKYVEYKDTCAIRVSHALNQGGDPIPWAGGGVNNPYVGGKVRTDKGGDGKFYIYSTLDMRAYLDTRYGKAERFKMSDKPAEKLQGRIGIIAFGWVHIDLWFGTKCAKQCYFDHKNVTEVLFWKTHSISEENGDVISSAAP
jgi:hypothetical protein